MSEGQYEKRKRRFLLPLHKADIGYPLRFGSNDRLLLAVCDCGDFCARQAGWPGDLQAKAPWKNRLGNRRGTNAYIAGGIVDVGADIFDRGCCLPSDNKLTAEQQDRIIKVIHACFE